MHQIGLGQQEMDIVAKAEVHRGGKKQQQATKGNPEPTYFKQYVRHKTFRHQSDELGILQIT